jgi:thymidylate kinase
MKLQSSSSQQRGLFVNVDGPSGAGKSTVVRHLAQLLAAAGESVRVMAEPSEDPIGKLCRELRKRISTGRPPSGSSKLASTYSARTATSCGPSRLPAPSATGSWCSARSTSK